ncbi:MAG: hypothetical protein LBG52_04160 [Candidatus Peribacteria bacterium]|jgi:hypothetical protein|nr:hypothetical protein [Candidatus Peribacteria bacterium]
MIQQQEHIPLSIIFLLEKYRGKKFTKKERIYLFSQAEELGKIRAQTFLYGTEREEIIPTK